MSSSHKKSRTIADDETFIRLIQVAQEDPLIGSRLKSILSQNELQQKIPNEHLD
jgi:hypothetical protein